MKSRKVETAFACVLAAGMLLMLAGGSAAQQAYPSKPIRFITPYAPGGQTTILAHLFGQKLSEAWGQSVIVDNRPGGNTIIGTEALVKAAPDGYTLILITNSHVILPNLYQTLPFDSIKDFAPVATTSSNETIMLVHPSVAANTLQELIALAKSKPGQLNYASLGTGGIQQVASEMFNLVAGVNTRGIPYKGAGPAIIALLGAEAQLSIQGTATSVPHVRSGRLRALAITGASRWSALPELPTFGEAGLPGYDIKYWQGVLAPAGTPAAIVEKIAQEIGRIQNLPDIRAQLVAQGLDPWISTPAQFAGALKTELAKYSKIIKAANIKLDE